MAVFGIVAGGWVDPTEVREISRKYKSIIWIAADSGAESLMMVGVYPDILVGDLDSISSHTLKKIKRAGKTNLYRFPAEKDYSDTYLAFDIVRQLSKKMRKSKVVVLGAIGSRIDHSLSNLQIAYDFIKDFTVLFYTKNHCLIPCQAPVRLLLSKKKAFPYLSIYPISERIEELTLQGVRYPLNGYCAVQQNASLLLSNEIIESKAFIQAKQGRFLIIRSRD